MLSLLAIERALAGKAEYQHVMILECDSGRNSFPQRSASPSSSSLPPKYSVLVTGCHKDPRAAPVNKLVNWIDIPSPIVAGWIKVHEYIFLVDESTDMLGWQYRSEWTATTEEPWTPDRPPVGGSPGVRRRLWMTTLVKIDVVGLAKALLYDQLRSNLSENTAVRTDALNDRSLTITIRQQTFELMDHTAQTERTIPLEQCELPRTGNESLQIQVLDVKRHAMVTFEAPNLDFKLELLTLMNYYIALNAPQLNYHALPDGPTDTHHEDDFEDRILICGNLMKQGHFVKNWKSRFFRLTPHNLTYYRSSEFKGGLELADCVVRENVDGAPLDFILEKERENGGGKMVLRMRAANVAEKQSWVGAILRQIEVLNTAMAYAAGVASAKDASSADS